MAAAAAGVPGPMRLKFPGLELLCVFFAFEETMSIVESRPSVEVKVRTCL